jgi:beta-fructofuranosidase
MSDNPFGGWRTPRHDRIGSRRFYAAKSMADDKGNRYYFGWTPDRADRSDRGEWFWGGVFAVPHAVSRSLTAGELEVALPQAITDIFRKPIDWIYRPMEGESAATGKTVIAKSIGSLAYGFFEFSEPRFLMSCKVRSIDCRDSFGFAIKSDKNLARTLLLMFEPAAQRVSLLNYPMPVDPFWEASVASMVSSALPGPDGPRVAEDFFAFQDGETIDMKILVDHDLIEVFVDKTVALNYRWYDAAEFSLGVIVQDGTAEYQDIAIAACT